MCGRFTITLNNDQLNQFLSQRYDILNSKSFNIPRFNVAPSNNVISVISDGINYRVGELKWGFIPPYSKNHKKIEIINAKAETIFDNNVFKVSVINQRCVVLADSFYEWQKQNNQKQPYRILTDQLLFPMAAIWSTYKLEDGKKIHTVAIITTHSNNLMENIHDRMPVILNKETEKIWLNTNIKDRKILEKILIPYEPDKMHYHKVSNRVNATINDDRSLIEKISE